jgi:hypothetical protein
VWDTWYDVNPLLGLLCIGWESRLRNVVGGGVANCGVIEDTRFGFKILEPKIFINDDNDE